MELLDRYLQAVGFWLPKAQQKDIIAELGEDIRSQIEDKESALGRPLNEDEMVALLHQTGHPMRVAARYLPQQSLIGPMLFPLYRFVVKMVVFGYLAPWALVWASLMLFWPSYRESHLGLPMLGTWATFWSLGFSLLGMITLVFAIVDRFQSKIRWLNQWDPRKLPRVAQRKERVSRVESVFGLAFGIVFVVWWLGLPRYGHIMFGPEAGNLSLNPALRAYYLPALVPTLLVMIQQSINLARPQWTWLRAAVMLVADAIALGIIESVAKIYPYVLLSDAVKSVRYAQGMIVVNQVILWSVIGITLGICVALAVHAFQTVQAVRRLLEARGRQSPSHASQPL